MKKHRTAPEVKEQIINRIKNDGISVVQAAKDHGLSEATIYGWISKKVSGQPTLSEIIKLKRENTQHRYNTKRIHSALRMPPRQFARTYAPATLSPILRK